MKTVFSFIVLFGCLLFYGFAQSTEAGFDVSDWESSCKISKVTDKYECIVYLFNSDTSLREKSEVGISDIISEFEMDLPVKLTLFQFSTTYEMYMCMQYIITAEKDKDGKKIENPVFGESYIMADASSHTELTKEEFLRKCKREFDNLSYNYKKKSAQALQTLERVNKKIW